MNRSRRIAAAVTLALAATFGGSMFARSVPARSGAPVVTCESLSALPLTNARITRAQTVPAGRFAGTPEGVLAEGAASQRPYSLLPEFCRVAATLTPSADSEIKIEVWMPAAGWNGKFEALGNGGWAGTLAIQPLASALLRGYAAAATDTGHAGNGGDASFALNHPEKLIDFSDRAVHEMTGHAKTFIGAFYGTAPTRSYWNGCSTGGRQGLTEAQRYPDEYDGIIAGAPANYWTHLMASGVWAGQASHRDEAGYIPPAKYPALHAGVIAACDALDGVKDAVLEDPRRCRFDPASIQCKSGDSPSCLTAPQVATARALYAGAKNPRTGAVLYPGLAPGSEMQWSGLAGPEPLVITTSYFKYVLFKNPDWDFKTLDFDKDIARADALDIGRLNSIDPDLSRFVGRGGKLLMYHGWNDQLIAPQNSVNYYESVVKALGGAEKIAASVRLFMMPGVTHCAGGDGPSNFDQLAVLEQWVERGVAPDRIVASHLSAGVVDRTRPLCPYPQTAVYLGTGSTDEAASFICRKP